LNATLANLPARRVQRLVNKADFERLLASRSLSRSTHFALHHVTGSPVLRVWQPKRPLTDELSTELAAICGQPVDNLLAPGADPASLWLGYVVPKRYAPRAVTRSLLKRQVRGAFAQHANGLPAGLWLVRLRAPFAVTEFVSARSRALAQVARSELDSLLGRAAG
jgi:ribonuclease P protein component